MVVFPDPAGPSMAMITLKSRRRLQAGHLRGPKWPHAALGEVAELEPIDAHTLQVEHRMAQRLPEPAHFALAALAQDHRQPGVGAVAVEHLDLRRLESLPSHDHPLREPPEGVFVRPASDHD